MLFNNHELLNSPNRIMARHARQLSDAIILNLHIPEGSGLVPYLAPGQAQSNREAIRLWVSSHVNLLPVITPTTVESSSQRLADEINRALDMTQQEF
jgi:hypothetical protein